MHYNEEGDLVEGDDFEAPVGFEYNEDGELCKKVVIDEESDDALYDKEGNLIEEEEETPPRFSPIPKGLTREQFRAERDRRHRIIDAERRVRKRGR